VPERPLQARIYRASTQLDRRSTPGPEAGAMVNRAGATVMSSLAAIAETVDRGFDWGSAAIGLGAGAGLVLLIVAVAAALRGRSNGSYTRGGNPS
jgi:hypothetical protein